MDLDENIWIVCLTEKMAQWNPKHRLAGSIAKFCEKCQESVVLSIQGQEMVKEKPEAKLCCMNCMKEMVSKEKNKEDIKIGPVAGGLKAVKEEFGLTESDEFMRQRIEPQIKEILGLPTFSPEEEIKKLLDKKFKDK